MKVALLLMIALTVVYVGAVVYTVVYANTNVHSYDYADDYPGEEPPVVYAACKYEQDTPPTEWYTLEELGIIEVWEVGGRWVQIVVDREKEPFPFGPYGTSDQRTRFLYKDQFYTVADCWVTIDSLSTPIPIEAIGGALGAGWVVIGALLLKGRKKE